MPLRETVHSLKQKWEEIQKEFGDRSGQNHGQSAGQGYNVFPGQGQQFYYQQPPPPPQYYQPGQAQLQQPPSQQYTRPAQPPPVPYSSRPSPPASAPQAPTQLSAVYWQPRFDPGVPVSAEWEHKLGNNNGWGNAELENYTADASNSFYTPDHKLVIRAIANTSNPPTADHRYTSARLVSRQKLARPQGCLTAVLTSPCAPGIWPAFWLLPSEPFSWPHDGEVDIAETWNGDRNNKSCLHWGFFTPEDAGKHRTVGTQIDDMPVRPVRYEFAWDQRDGNGAGRLIWWIDGRPVMKADVPPGTRRLTDWQILLNVAIGGNVCAGQVPREGYYDFVVHEMKLAQEPEWGGWGRFERDWAVCREGNTM